MLWFRKKPKPEIVPMAGERFHLRGHDADPWGLANRPECTVVDVRDGWVRYRFSNAIADDVLKLDVFTSIYEYLPNRHKMPSKPRDEQRPQNQ